MSDFIKNTVTESITRRANSIARKIASHWELPGDELFTCYIAGGCLGESINDVDMFPSDEIPSPKLPLVAATKNAATYEASPYPIQICSYKKPTLESLVESFDFAHIQVGAEIVLGGYPIVNRVYFTDAFVAARATHSTWFIGSDYPLSSILRAGKYFKSGAIHRPTYIRCVISALTATIKRGFKDYADFKDQLDAVDLGLLPEDQKEIDKCGLLELFGSLQK